MHQIAIIVSDFNQLITSQLLHGAIEELSKSHIKKEELSIIHVPGAIEIPLIAQLLAKTNQYHAIICLGCVIRGETDHYDHVCEQVSFGCQRVMLDYSIPVIFGVLTTDTLQKAYERVGGIEGHKGKEAASVALQMISIVDKLKDHSICAYSHA